MHKTVIPLLKNFDRPVISLYGMNTLIDPGSVPLVLDMDEETVQYLFGGEYTGHTKNVKGIGESQSKIYKLKSFCFGGIVFKDFPALVCPIEDKEAPIIIGCSMYSRGTKYTIDTEQNQITFEFPDVFFLSGKPCIKKNGEWVYLDFKNGKFCSLPVSY